MASRHIDITNVLALLCHTRSISVKGLELVMDNIDFHVFSPQELKLAEHLNSQLPFDSSSDEDENGTSPDFSDLTQVSMGTFATFDAKTSSGDQMNSCCEGVNDQVRDSCESGVKSSQGTLLTTSISPVRSNDCDIDWSESEFESEESSMISRGKTVHVPSNCTRDQSESEVFERSASTSH